MKKALTYLLLTLDILFSASCERRPMYDGLGGRLYIDIDLNIDIDVESRYEGDRVPVPDLFEVQFYHPTTHRLIYTTYVPSTGGFVEVPPGRYDIMIYNFNTDYTQLREKQDMDAIEAFTSEVTAELSSRFTNLAKIIEKHRPSKASNFWDTDPLIYEPDHLYADIREDVLIPTAVDQQETIHITMAPTTILEKYRLTIGPVLNGEYIRTADIFLTGMGSAKLVAKRQMSKGPAIIWFPIYFDDEADRLKTSFLTFGKYPGADNRVILIVHVIDVSGNEYDGEWDVTDQIDSGSHDLVIDVPIEIEPTPGGGASPTVNLWHENETTIVLQ